METRQIYLSCEMANRGHNVKVFTSTANHFLSSQPKKDEESFDRVTVHWLKTINYNKPYGFLRIISWFDFELKLFSKLRKLELQKTDMVIVSSLSLLSICNGVYLKKKFGCKLLFEIRDIWPLVLKRISNISRYNPFYLFLQWLEKFGYKNDNLIIGSMPNLASHVKNVISEPKKIIWVPHLINKRINYVSEHRYSTFFKQIKLQFKEIVCYAGSINKSSGLEYIIQAFNDDDLKDYALILLGDGPQKEILRKRLRFSNVFFLDKVPQKEVVAILKECDILYDGYLKSKLYKFGTSRNKYVEYCLAAKPILVSYQGYQIFVEQNQCGNVIEPESSKAIVQGVLNISSLDFQSRNKLGENAFKFAQNNLSVSNKVDEILECIEI